MKKLILLPLLLTHASFLIGQIRYEKDFSTTLKKAAETKRPIFLNIGFTPKKTIKSAIKSKEVAQFYNSKFVSYNSSSIKETFKSLMADR